MDTPLRVSLACGQRKPEGFVGVDIVPLDGVDIVHDLDVMPWPFETGSVDEVECSHFIEHLVNMIPFMNELHRIMKPGGTARIVTPYYTSMRAWQDPTHKRAISEATYLYFNKGWREANKLDHYGITADFDYTFAYGLAEDWAKRSDEARTFAIRHYWNVVSDLYVTLTKRG